MTRTLLLLGMAVFILSSCAKKIQEHIIGEWRLESSYRKELFGRDHFQTGYEDGIFTFYESGAARYIYNHDTLTGYWRSDFYTRWRGDVDEDDSERLKYLEVYLANFNRNKIIEWRFDNFKFKDSWKRIKAVEFTIGRDRYYEFVQP